MNILKYLELPHVGNYKGWRRKALIILAFPQEACARSTTPSRLPSIAGGLTRLYDLPHQRG
jgi:hypothetical protein